MSCLLAQMSEVKQPLSHSISFWKHESETINLKDSSPSPEVKNRHMTVQEDAWPWAWSAQLSALFRHKITHLHPSISWRGLLGSPEKLSINFFVWKRNILQFSEWTKGSISNIWAQAAGPTSGLGLFSTKWVKCKRTHWTEVTADWSHTLPQYLQCTYVTQQLFPGRK